MYLNLIIILVMMRKHLLLMRQKGNFIKATNVQYLFKQNNYIPSNVFLEDTYKKRVRIFSLVKDSLKLRKR